MANAEHRDEGARAKRGPRQGARVFASIAFALFLCIGGEHAAAIERAATVTGADLVVVTSAALPRDVTRANAPLRAGTRVEFRIVIAHRASAPEPARDIVVRDDLSGATGAGRFAFVADSYGDTPPRGIEVRAPNLNGGAPIALTNAVDGDAASFASGVVHVRGIDLAPGETATLRFQVVLR